MVNQLVNFHFFAHQNAAYILGLFSKVFFCSFDPQGNTAALREHFQILRKNGLTRILSFNFICEKN